MMIKANKSAGKKVAKVKKSSDAQTAVLSIFDKGNGQSFPTILLDPQEPDYRRQTKFGVRKAKLIVLNYERIKKFAETDGKSVE